MASSGGLFFDSFKKLTVHPNHFAEKHILVGMKKPVQISIPSPCHENWDTMMPAEKGRFCGSCQKVVHDFTRSSDREIASVLATDNGACGRFLNTQLERDLTTSKEKSTPWIAASVAIVSLAVGTDAVAQTPTPIEQHSQDRREIMGKVGASKTRSVITGTVKDSAGLAIPGVNVIIKGTLIAAQTDFDGNYSIEANTGDTIEYSFVGMGTISATVQNVNSICVTMNEDLQSYTIGMIITTKKRSLFGRVFTSIGNLFREENKNVNYRQF